MMPEANQDRESRPNFEVLRSPITVQLGEKNVQVNHIGTSNKGKLADFAKSKLQLDPLKLDKDLIERQLTDEEIAQTKAGNYLYHSHAIAEAKAKTAFKECGEPVLVEDTGLHIEALPLVAGPNIKLWVEEDAGLEKLCALVDHLNTSRSAVAYCTLAVSDGEKEVSWSGQIKGIIAPQPRGENGFGWDSIFIPEPDKQISMGGNFNPPKTYGEMTPEQKAEFFSFRRPAVEALAKSLVQ